MLGHIVGLISNPVEEWRKIAAQSDEQMKRSILGFMLLGLIPPVAAYIGITKVGWLILGGGEERVRITAESAIPGLVLFYVALMAGAIFIGFMMHWMSETYGVSTSKARGAMFLLYCHLPIFLCGIAMAYPLWWLDLILATAACSYAIRLLYLGVSPVMGVPEDRGFLYASAAFAVALVYVVVILTATVIAWEYIATPVFTD